MLRGYGRMFLVVMVVLLAVAIYFNRHNDGELVKDCRVAGYKVVKEQGAHYCVDPSTGKTVAP
jgi:hypothetical protein